MATPSTPEIAVVIATYKRPHLIERALDSVAAQSLRPREIIVVDDASGDNTGEVVAAWSARSGLPVQFISAAANGGAGVARNLAMQTAKSPLIAFLDSDDAYMTDALARLAAPLLAFPDAVVSFADAEQRWSDGTPPRPMMRTVVRKGVDTKAVPGPDGSEWHRLNDPQSILLLTSPIPTCSAIFRRSAAQAVGWMPDYRHGEDWLFWLKLTGQGDFICQFIDTAIVHRQGDNLTGADHDARTAQLTLNAFLKLQAGEFGIALAPDNRARLAEAVAEKMRHLRYHASRKGIAYYWQTLGSPEARANTHRLSHIWRDPKSVLRALLSSVRR